LEIETGLIDRMKTRLRKELADRFDDDEAGDR